MDRETTETTLTSGAGLRILIQEMNPRTKCLMENISIDWCPAYLREHKDDYVQLERLGLIEMRYDPSAFPGTSTVVRRTMRETW